MAKMNLVAYALIGAAVAGVGIALDMIAPGGIGVTGPLLSGLTGAAGAAILDYTRIVKVQS